MRTLLSCGVLGVLCAGVAAAEDLPPMKFNDVKEVAPGVFFRYSSISATDKSVVFGGSNNIWVVFDEFVVVIDANFPKEAGDVIAAVRKTTPKPIRYVFDTHHHGDHAFGNGVFAKAGASVVAQANCARILRTTGPKDYADAGKGPNAREDVKTAPFKAADVVFDDRLVLDDGKQRIELLHFGHGHTAGDAVAYLPKHRVLCTGDACVNGAFNYMGQGDSASWIRALEKMQQLDVRLICPGHGMLSGKELLEKQKHYFQDLRKEVQKSIDAGTPLNDVIKNFELPWYKEWTGVQPAGDNIKQVYGELTGSATQWDLTEEFGIVEGPSPTKGSPGWEKPKRIVVPSGLMPGQLEQLKRIAPEVEFIPAKTPEDAGSLAADADAVIGYCTPNIVLGKKVRWVQAGATGIDPEVEKALTSPPVVRSVTLTSAQCVHGPATAERAFALLLRLTSGQPAREGDGPPPELHGKTMLVIGVGPAGKQISRRAHAFGMRVHAIDHRAVERPSCVFSLDKLDRLGDLLPQADVVVVACPLTSETRSLIGDRELKKMKRTAYLIHVAPRDVVRLWELADAMKNKVVAGIGLDVTGPDSVPSDDPLRKMSGVVFNPGPAGPSAEAAERQWRLYRENLRRFVAGEQLLCVVDLSPKHH